MIRLATIARTVWLEMLRKKDFYVLAILLAALLMALLSVNVFGLEGVTRYVKDLGLLLTWICSWVLAIGTMARQLPQEEARGTIYPLLAKPVSRAEMLLGKWLGAWSIVTAATAIFYVLVLGVTLLRGGSFDAGTLAQAFLLHAVNLAIVTALALALSTRLTAGAASTLAYVATLTAYVMVPQIPVLLTRESGFRATALYFLYYALPHFELFDLRQRLVHGWGAAPWGLVLVVALYGAFWAAFFWLLAWAAYRKKRFSRGGVM
jgi:ABC-type transport system involved in multi-copper enzyme maturation permease subunit